MMIEACSFGSMRVDGKDYDRDLLILPGGVRPGWRRKEGHSLCLEDLSAVWAEKPEVLVVGRGQSGVMRIPDPVKKALEQKGVRLVDAETPRAAILFNELVDSGKRVAGAFHLTC